MKKQGKQKRKLNQYKKYIEKKYEDDNYSNQENENNENYENIKEKKKKGKKNKNNKNKDIKNDSILVTSKESCYLIKKIMTEGEKPEDNNENINNFADDNCNNKDNDNINYNINDEIYDKKEQKKKNNKKKKNNGDNDNDNKDDENEDEDNKKIKEKKDKKDKNDDDDGDITNKNNEEANNTNDKDNSNDNDGEKNKNKNIDNFLLSSIYDLFEGYDEIIIKPNNNNQYVINGCLKIDEDKEIKFEINYDKERDFFDYYPNNTNFVFENEDEPFNWDLDIPKEDFSLLIKNFKKYKNK